MTKRRLPFRICAVIAAYALVLHALAANIAFAQQPAGDAITCIVAPGAQPPAGQESANSQDKNHDRSSCVLHCLAVGGTDGGAPPVTIVLEIFAPFETRIAPVLLELPSRLNFKTPQSPRAPPLT